jgi:hypothetical protein
MFLPSSYLRSFVRFSTTSNQSIDFHPWNIALTKGCFEMTFSNGLDAFKKPFCVHCTTMSFETFGASIDVHVTIVQQRESLQNTIVTLHLDVSAQEVSRCRRRIDILKEILTTERSYLRSLNLMIQLFTPEFFEKFGFPKQVFQRTWKAIAEHKPTHGTF